MDRRQFLAYGTAGALTLGLSPGLGFAQTANQVTFELSIEPVDVEMIDGKRLYMLLFYGGAGANKTPRPVLRVREGQSVTVILRNNAPEPHRFQVPGVSGAAITQIAPGATKQITFTAPVAGTYIYLDPLNAPANRLLGLHGAFIVDPIEGRTLAGSPTPYSRAKHTPAIAAMFDAFGSHRRFPGDKWNPADPEREKTWIFMQHDPRLNAMAEQRQTIVGADIINWFTPRYFTINGLSGFDLDEEPSVQATGYVGQPTLIRTMNAGLATHSAHIHGNHVFETTHALPSGAVQFNSNLYELDAWSMPPLQRTDVLLPFERPPDIPDAVWPPREEPFPMRFVMHCHTEMSQTAGGGNYPQGLVMHWELLGPLRNT